MSARLTEEEFANILANRRGIARQRLSKASRAGGRVIHPVASKSPATHAQAKGKGRVPQRTPGQMNSLEKSYAETVLAPRKLAGEIIEWWFEAITLKLADDCRYTPDFLVMLSDHSLECHEIKGFMRDDAQVKLKIAAQMFPFKFILCKKQTKKEGGTWIIKELKQSVA